jgi:CshA-type fibril repeat protein
VTVTGGVVTLNASGTLTFTPNANYTGSPSFTYTVSDGAGGTATASVSGTVTPVEDVPIAQDDRVVIEQNQDVRIAVLTNDRDPDGDPLTITGLTASTGTATLNPDGTVTFTPPDDFIGTVTLTYVVSDGKGGTDTATVTIDVTEPMVPTPIPPVVIDERPRDEPAPGIVVDGAVLAAVDGVTTLGGVSDRISVDGIVLAATNAIESLGGIAPSLDIAGLIVAAEVERLENLRTLEPLTRQHFGPPSLQAWEPHGLTGFSLRYDVTGAIGSSAHAILVVETLVRQETLMVQLSSESERDRDQPVEYRVTRSDGRPAPAWLDRVGRDFLIGRPPVNEEEISLRIVAIYADGRTVVRDVVIQTTTGEIQPVKLERRSEGPAMLSAQFSLAAAGGRTATDDLVAEFR